MSKGRSERERKRGHGDLLLGMGAASFDAIGTLGEVSLNRYKD